MRVGEASGTANTAVAQSQQRKQNISKLMSSLKSGDAEAAKQAYAALANGKSGKVPPNSPLAKLGKALQSGDLAGAQQVAQQMQARRAEHHRHSAEQASPAARAAPTPAVHHDPSVGSLINVTA